MGAVHSYWFIAEMTAPTDRKEKTMRLIDADALIESIEQGKGKNSIYAQFVRAYTKEAPAIDAVPVVRCKDCKWMEKNVFGGQYCNYRYGNIRLDDFCSCGERKDNE